MEDGVVVVAGVARPREMTLNRDGSLGRSARVKKSFDTEAVRRQRGHRPTDTGRPLPGRGSVRPPYLAFPFKSPTIPTR